MNTPPTDVKARQILKDVFGYDSFRSGQEEVIKTLLDGANVLAVMPTGSGKSFCFQIPALVKGGLTLVVSPLVALMEDQVAALKLAGVAADAINSSHDRDINVETWRRAAAGDTRLLYMAPERLMTERMLEALGRLPIKLIAIDEAHCISRWGPSFRPEYEDLARLGGLFPGVAIAAFTATADEATRNDIATKLFDGQGRMFVSGFDRPNIRLAVEMRRDEKRQLLDFIQAHEGESGIVYCLSRKKTEETAAFLKANGVHALAYHAGMEKRDRAANQDIFMTDPAAVMVATIAFGMGIDKSDARFVFHTDLPASVEAYYQEIGRCGRDGAPAFAQMLYGLGDIRMRRMFIEQDGDDADHKRREHKRLDMLIAICESPQCRRQALLSYFGESKEPCGNCDVCQNPPEMEDGLVVGQKALSAAYRTGQCFGAAHLIDILRGADTEKIRDKGHQNLPTYGAGADLSKESWRSIIRQMVAAGYFQLDVQGYGGLSISQKGHALLQGEEFFQYRKDSLAPAKKKAAKKKNPPPPEFSDSEAALLLALKELRLNLAQQRDVPAFVIFPDSALVDMALKKPLNVTDFAEVHGVGAAKLRDFSEPFLKVIEEHAYNPRE